MKRALVIFFACVTTCVALTPKERTIVLHARAQLQAAMEDFAQAKTAAAEADQRVYQAQLQANAADDHAVEANRALAKAEKDVTAAHNREVALAVDNQRMRPVYTRVQKYWGIGAIGYGLQMLARHLLYAILVLAVVAIVLVVLSFLFPVIGVVSRAVLALFHRRS